MPTSGRLTFVALKGRNVSDDEEVPLGELPNPYLQLAPPSQWVKSPKKQSERVRFLLTLKYSAMLSKIHSYRLLFWRFCLRGCYTENIRESKFRVLAGKLLPIIILRLKKT